MAAPSRSSWSEADPSRLIGPQKASKAAPASPLAPPYSPITPRMSNSSIPTPAFPNPAELSQPSVTYSQPQQPLSTDQSSLNSPPSAASNVPQSTPTVPSQPHPQRPSSPQEPPPQPLDLSTNTDAIALKAAMSVLTLQRQQAIRDMQVLEQQKQTALADPEAFADAVRSGQVKMKEDIGGGIQFSYDGDAASDDSEEEAVHQGLEDDTAMDTSFNSEAGPAAIATTAMDSQNRKHKNPHKKYSPLPRAQNVVRTPPVNWSKYHIVGPALDRLHVSQRQDPEQGRPRTDQDVRNARERHEQLKLAKQKEGLRKLAQQGRVPGRRSGTGSLVAAPYDVFQDEVLGRGELDAVMKTSGETEAQQLSSAGAQKKGKGESSANKKARKSGQDAGVSAANSGSLGAASPAATSNSKKKGTATGVSNNKKKKGGRGRPPGSGIHQKAANAAAVPPNIVAPTVGAQPVLQSSVHGSGVGPQESSGMEPVASASSIPSFTPDGPRIEDGETEEGIT